MTPVVATALIGVAIGAAGLGVLLFFVRLADYALRLLAVAVLALGSALAVLGLDWIWFAVFCLAATFLCVGAERIHPRRPPWW